MRRLRAHVAEIVRRIDDAAAEMIVPNPIDDGAPGERIPRIADPKCQGDAAAALVLWIVELEPRFEGADAFECAGFGFGAGLVDVAALEHVDLARLAGGPKAPVRFEVTSGRIDQFHGRQCGELEVNLL